MKVYVGITIGPIVEVLCETSTPSALWFGSSMFSDITRRICLKINSEWENSAQIYSPYFDAVSAASYPSDGVGKYHDHIIFSIENSEMEKDALVSDTRKKLVDIVSLVKTETINIFPPSIRANHNEEDLKKFLNKYIQIHFVILGEEQVQGNAILVISPYLDELELMKSFPATSRENIFVELFSMLRKDDADASINDYVRESELFTAIKGTDNGFLINRRFKTLKDIANVGNDLEKKYAYYYAVVTADGDGMGKFLNSISTQKVTSFSKGCLEYNIQAAEQVKKFGGMPIYAGGDDLLFIAPVMGKDAEGNPRYIMELCEDINKLFVSVVKKSMIEQGQDVSKLPIPSISFGISINYYKYPLYEAFSNSRSLLEEIKGGKNGGQKNSIAIGFQKHSGQSLTLYVGNGDKDFDVFNSFLHKNDPETKKVSSLIKNLEKFYVLIETAVAEARINKDWDSFLNVWKNIYDNTGQKKYLDYVKTTAKEFFEGFIMNEARISATDENGKEKEAIGVLADILKLDKFYIEKAGDD